MRLALFCSFVDNEIVLCYHESAQVIKERRTRSMKNLSVAPRRILFIGNSATYVHDIPGTLRRLAGLAGYPIEVDSVVKRGYTLAQHADNDSEHGKKVLAAIEKGWDVVFLQDNGNCVTSPEKEESCRTLHQANRAFAFGIRRGISLWGTNNAHTSEQGAYLACARFSPYCSASPPGFWTQRSCRRGCRSSAEDCGRSSAGTKTILVKNDIFGECI